MKAKLDPKRGRSGGGAKMIHADPRFTRTSAVSDIYARIRTGTDVAYFGGLINYVLAEQPDPPRVRPELHERRPSS